jgi:hypothetical protein
MRVLFVKPWGIWAPGERGELDPPIVEILEGRGIVERERRAEPLESAATDGGTRASPPQKPERRRRC